MLHADHYVAVKSDIALPAQACAIFALCIIYECVHLRKYVAAVGKIC